ncbi:MAG TPA: hypothetical protein DEA08_33540 [Planctomycetes bacterium]|nr:hypothetical protein [Planctomycetota bacterium]
MAEGSEGPAVRELQLALGQLGKEVAVDGAFGPETKSALTALQQEHGLAADGIVGPSTGAALDYLLLEEVDPLELREDWQVARTDDEGVLHLPRFPLGYATVKLSGYEAQSLPVLDDGPASADGAAAEPEAEEEPEEPYLLMLRPELGVARVHVLDGDGLPVGSLAYELASDSVHRAGTLSPSGELLEERLPLGYYELSVRGRGSASVPTVGSRWAAPHVLVVGPDLMGGDLDDDDTEEERNG